MKKNYFVYFIFIAVSTITFFNNFSSLSLRGVSSLSLRGVKQRSNLIPFSWFEFHNSNHTTALAASKSTQTSGPRLLIIPSAEKVYIFALDIPSDQYSGFYVYRAEKSNPKNFAKLTTTPVLPIDNVDTVKEMLGDDFSGFAKVFKVNTVEEFLAMLKKEKGKASFLSLYSLSLSKALGRVYVDEEVEKEGQYIYKITLVNTQDSETGSSSPAETIVHIPEIPSPLKFNTKALDSAVELTWAKPQEVNLIIVGFNIYRATGETEFQKINSKIIAETGDKKYTDYQVTNGTKYYYRMTSLDMIGNESPPSETASATPLDMTPPNVPEGLTTSLKDAEVELVWKMNLELDMAYYDVYKSNKADGEYKKINTEPLPPDVTFFKDSELIENSDMWYGIVAVDKADNKSRRSQSVSINIPDKLAPKTPSGFKGKAKKGGVDLKWEQGKEKDLYGYYIYRGTSPDDIVKITPAVLPKEKTSYTDMGLQSGQKYYYLITAIDAAFNESAKNEPIEIAAVDTRPPDIPVGLFAAAGDSKIDVAWRANVEPDLAGYNLYNYDEKTKKYTKIKTFDKTVNSYTDTNVKNGIRNYYALSSLDETENESEKADPVYAIPKDDTPPVVPAAPNAEPSTNTIKIKWQKNIEGDLQGYIIYRTEEIPTGVYNSLLTQTHVGAGSKPAQLAQPILKTEYYIDKKVEKGKTYFYKITAVDTSGNESERSESTSPVSLKEETAEAGKTGTAGKTVTTTGVQKKGTTASKVKTQSKSTKNITASQKLKAKTKIQSKEGAGSKPARTETTNVGAGSKPAHQPPQKRANKGKK